VNQEKCKMDKLEELKQELKELEESNKAAWDMWGSELCAGDMERQERILKEQINKLEREELKKKWTYSNK